MLRLRPATCQSELALTKPPSRFVWLHSPAPAARVPRRSPWKDVTPTPRWLEAALSLSKLALRPCPAEWRRLAATTRPSTRRRQAQCPRWQTRPRRRTACIGRFCSTQRNSPRIWSSLHRKATLTVGPPARRVASLPLAEPQPRVCTPAQDNSPGACATLRSVTTAGAAPDNGLPATCGHAGGAKAAVGDDTQDHHPVRPAGCCSRCLLRDSLGGARAAVGKGCFPARQ